MTVESRRARWVWMTGWGFILVSILLPTVFLWTWVSGVGDLLATRPGFIAMSPYAAGMVLAMAAVLVLHRSIPESARSGTAARMVGVGVLVIGIIPALETSLGTPGLPERWITESALMALGRVSGQLSESTGLILGLLGLTLALAPPGSDRTRPGVRRVALAFTLLAVAISLVVLLEGGYVGIRRFLFGWRGISFWTALFTITLGSVIGLDQARAGWQGRPAGSHLAITSMPWRATVLITLLAMTLGSLYVRSERRQVRGAAARDLRAIAEAKVNAVAQWRTERLSDARFFGQAAFVARDLRAFIEDSENVRHRTSVEDWLRLLKAGDRYREVNLMDRNGQVRLSASDAPTTKLERAPESYFPPEVLATNGVVMTDVSADRSTREPLVMLLAPIPERVSRREDALAGEGDTNGDWVGFLRLSISASRHLFPLIQSWPTPSLTAETLLCSEDADGLALLTPPRLGLPGVGPWRLPVNGIRTAPGVRVERGGVVDGLDYRDVAVLAVVRAVPGSSWRLVVKIDREEVFNAIRQEAWLTLGLVIVLSVGGGLGMAYAWERQRHALELVRLGLAERVALLMQQANDIVLLLDEDGDILEANRRAVEAYGYTQDQLTGMGWRQLEASTSQEAFLRQLDQSLRERGRLIESFHTRRDGSRFPVEYSLAAVEVRGRRYVQAIVRDLTERHRLAREREEIEAKMRQSQKLEAIGTLASGVAHEINNPITGVINYAQLIVDHSPEDAAVSKYAREVIRETGRVAGIVRQLLQFARRDAGGHAPETVSVLVEGTVALIRGLLKRDLIALEVDVPANLPPLPCRGPQIQQVLMNLVTNARDATVERWGTSRGDRRIRIVGVLRQRDGTRWVRLSVEDRGCGIPDDIRDRIFDPFFTTKPRERGTGLGLSISHGIVKEHGGDLLVESVEGGGTVFHVDLPVDGAASGTSPGSGPGNLPE